MEEYVEFGYKPSTCSGKEKKTENLFRVSCKMIHNVQVPFCSVLSYVRRTVKFSVLSLRPLVLLIRAVLRWSWRIAIVYTCVCVCVCIKI